MFTPFSIFIRGLGLYLLFTLPALVVPVIYAFSAFYAIVFGSASGIAFTILYLLIARAIIPFTVKRTSLFVAVVVSVAVGYLLIGLTNAAPDMWGFNSFLLFPVVAVIAGWASLFVGRKTLRKELDTNSAEYHYH